MRARTITASMAGLLAGLMAVSTVAPAAHAAEASAAVATKKPKNSISAPATGVVGEEITVKTVFNARNRKDKCFSPEITYGDEDPGAVNITMGICMNPSASKKFSTERETATHVYNRPGTYTITAQAAYVDGVGAFSGERETKALNKFIKGPRTVSTTITITSPDQRDLAADQKAAILTPGAVYSSREDIVNLVNALGWSDLWVSDLYSPELAGDVTYDVANGQQFVTRRFVGADGQTYGQVFISPENTAVRVTLPAYSAAGAFPEGGHIVFDARQWTASDGSPIPGMYVWSTNPTKGVARPVG